MTRTELRQLMKERGIPAREIAEKVGLARSSISDTLTGRSKHPATRALIALTLGLEPKRIDWSR